MNNQYRIVTNGLKFKIQQLTVEGFFRKKFVWRDMGASLGLTFIPQLFDTIEDAKECMNKLCKETHWRVVEESEMGDYSNETNGSRCIGPI